MLMRVLGGFYLPNTRSHISFCQLGGLYDINKYLAGNLGAEHVGVIFPGDLKTDIFIEWGITCDNNAGIWR
jgi:hypothetical protein